jgi:anti-anti-sigma regulatory factor
MTVKIDTKEKFHVLMPMETALSENMTGEFSQLLLSHLEKDVKNIVLNLSKVELVDDKLANSLVDIQQQFYDQQCSFVICEMQPTLEDFFEKSELLEQLNFTPTESEAWDIVQMEEIEREFLDE